MLAATAHKNSTSLTRSKSVINVSDLTCLRSVLLQCFLLRQKVLKHQIYPLFTVLHMYTAARHKLINLRSNFSHASVFHFLFHPFTDDCGRGCGGHECVRVAGSVPQSWDEVSRSYYRSASWTDAAGEQPVFTVFSSSVQLGIAHRQCCLRSAGAEWFRFALEDKFILEKNEEYCRTWW